MFASDGKAMCAQWKGRHSCSATVPCSTEALRLHLHLYPLVGQTQRADKTLQGRCKHSGGFYSVPLRMLNEGRPPGTMTDAIEGHDTCSQAEGNDTGGRKKATAYVKQDQPRTAGGESSERTRKSKTASKGAVLAAADVWWSRKATV